MRRGEENEAVNRPIKVEPAPNTSHAGSMEPAGQRLLRIQAAHTKHNVAFHRSSLPRESMHNAYEYTDSARLAEIVRTHCLSRNLPIPEMSSHGGFALSGGEACAVHVSARGPLLEFVIAAGRVPDDMLAASDEPSEMPQFSTQAAPISMAQDTSVPRHWMHERTEVDPQTRLLMLRRWLSFGQADEEIFSSTVNALRRQAHLWRTLFDLETT